MPLPTADTPLYNHPLPEIEQWLTKLGAKQDQNELHQWSVERLNWKAEICLEIEELVVRYISVDEGSQDIVRSFKYSLSRRDVEAAVFSGP